MNEKITRLEKCIAGDRPDRTPIALWCHFPVDDQTPEGLAGAALDFQRTYDFDLIKVTPASSFCLRDWGSEDEWRGATEGTRDYTRTVINGPEDWETLNVLDPSAGFLGKQLACLQLIVKESKQQHDPVPVIQTIFSPLAQAKNLVGKSALVAMLRQNPQAVLAGLATITESTVRFLVEARKTGIDGIFYAVQHANYPILTEAEFKEFGAKFDLEVLEAAKGLWLNMLHLHGEDVMFDLVADYPVAIMNWHDRDTAPSLSEGKKRFSGAVCGGLQRERTMVLGTPQQVQDEAVDAIRATDGKRFILGTGCVLPIIAPRANVLAARQAVEF